VAVCNVLSCVRNGNVSYILSHIVLVLSRKAEKNPPASYMAVASLPAFASIPMIQLGLRTSAQTLLLQFSPLSRVISARLVIQVRREFEKSRHPLGKNSVLIRKAAPIKLSMIRNRLIYL